MNLFKNKTKEAPSFKKGSQPKQPTWLMAGVAILLILIVLVLTLLITKDRKGSKDQSLNIPSGTAGELITINLDNQVSVTLPQNLTVYSGWKESIELIFSNNSLEMQTVNLRFNASPFTYLENQTTVYDNPDEIKDLFTVNLEHHAVKEVKLAIQTLKVWDNYFTLYLNEKSQPVNLIVELAEKTPIFGKDTEACATNQPFITYFGPDCGEGACDGISTDRNCIVTAKRSGSHTCWPYKFEFYPPKENDILNQCQQSLKYSSQITRNAPIAWNIMVEEDRYAWEEADWYIETLSSRVKAQQGLPSGIMNGDGGWVVSCDNCTNPDGSKGFFDIHNDYLSNKFRQFVNDLSARYGGKLNYYEMANEPAAEFYLCSCGLTTVPEFTFIPANTPLCNAPSGPNQSVCAGGDHSYKQDFAEAYGDFLAGTVKIASEEIKKNNPNALIVTGAIDDQNLGLTPITRYMIEQDILDNDNVAIGIHQYPHNGLQQLWSTEPVNCAYYQKPEPENVYWLPEECEKAPPFSGFSKPEKNKNSTMGDIWQEMDNRYDASEILKDLEALGVLDKAYFFDSELHAGFYNVEPKYDLTEAIAGVRIGVVNAHQKYLGTVYVLMPDTDFSASVFNLMVKTLTGATPAYQWQSKLIDSDYSSVVYKLFTRGQEDILVFWSNNDESKDVELELNNSEFQFLDSEIITLDADKGTTGFINLAKPSSLLTNFTVKPVKEIKIISVLRQDKQEPFSWLKSINYQ